MRFIRKRLKFNIFLLKEDIDQEDYMIIYDASDPSNITSAVEGITNKIYGVDVGDDDPSMGDSLFYTETTSTTNEGQHDYLYIVFDQYGNEGDNSDIFSVDVCLIPVKPIISDPVYSAPTLTFKITQNG